MAEVETARCPTCREPIVEVALTLKRVEGRGNQLQILSSEERGERRATCAAGHSFEVAEEVVDRGGRRLTLRVPEPSGRGSLTERATSEPCVGCGGPIQPTQAYVEGPRHLGC